MEYVIHIGILSGIYAVVAIALNLLVGYTGLVSLAHMAFFAIGAYTVAILTTAFHMNFFIAAAIGIIVAAIAAFSIGLVLSRFRDDFYILCSVGFTIIMYSVFLSWSEVTRGPLGIPGIPRPVFLGLDFGNNTLFFMKVLLAVGLAYWKSDFLVRSSFGRALKAIREDEQALQIFGYQTTYYKLMIFVIAAAMAALAGALFASYITYIDPSIAVLNESIFVLSIIILGGLADLRGSVLGAIVLIFLPEILRFVGFPADIAGQMRQLLYGVLLVLCMLYRPQGFLGKYKM